MCKENDNKNNIEKPNIPLECPPRENKTVTEPIEDIKKKIEF